MPLRTSDACHQVRIYYTSAQNTLTFTLCRILSDQKALWLMGQRSKETSWLCGRQRDI